MEIKCVGERASLTGDIKYKVLEARKELDMFKNRKEIIVVGVG